MARDYKARRKPAGGFSGWMGVLCGLGLGLTVAGIVYLKDRHSDSPAVQSVKAGKKKSHGGEQRGAEVPDAEAADSGAPEEPAKSYDFYSRSEEHTSELQSLAYLV